MRITSGLAGGRPIDAPKGVRPTQERVREAYFSKVAAMTADCRFLDLFSGSGAVGLEAWSRGASRSILVDKSRACVRFARRNADKLSADGVNCVCLAVNQFLEQTPNEACDLIYADPPYVLAEEQGFSQELLERVKRAGWLEENGIITIERRVGPEPEECAGWKLLDSKKYGESALDFYCQV